ncbi:MAG: hypothetical protein KDB07_10630 [Planctomycetes bacterium]|nr:hypothetical protein [Planctomycetota bacterium]
MTRKTYAEHLSQSALPQTQALQFLGTDNTNGLFSFPFPVLIQGVWGISQGNQSMAWDITAGIEDPSNPGTFEYFVIIPNATATESSKGDFNMLLPKNSRIRFLTNSVVGANLYAIVTYRILQEAL